MEIPDETYADLLAENQRLRAVVEAARECVSECNLAPDSSAHRQWCVAHHEWTPCSNAILAAALASLDLP